VKPVEIICERTREKGMDGNGVGDKLRVKQIGGQGRGGIKRKGTKKHCVNERVGPGKVLNAKRKW